MFVCCKKFGRMFRSRFVYFINFMNGVVFCFCMLFVMLNIKFLNFKFFSVVCLFVYYDVRSFVCSSYVSNVASYVLNRMFLVLMYF